jgi:phenylalanine N-monooxygenase
MGYATLENDSVRLTINVFFFLITTFVFIFPLIFHRKSEQRRPLPPGPTPWPIVGNLPELWRNKPAFRWIHDLMKELNTEIACVRLAGVHVIPVTSPEIGRELLKQHDAIFASRPLTMATEYASRGFKTIAPVPWTDQWKKMRKVVASNIINSTTLHWLLTKRTEEADNLVRFIRNQSEKSSFVVDVRLAIRQYCGNVMRKMMFNKRYFGKGSKDGGPGVEEVEHVESLLSLLTHSYAFAVSDYLPCLRMLDLDGHEKIVIEAMRIVTSYEEPIIDERVEQWRHGKKEEAEDLLDTFILAKDSSGEPALSVEEIKAQVTAS